MMHKKEKETGGELAVQPGGSQDPGFLILAADCCRLMLLQRFFQTENSRPCMSPFFKLHVLFVSAYFGENRTSLQNAIPMSQGP
jgi:hypothetical protein